MTIRAPASSARRYRASASGTTRYRLWVQPPTSSGRRISRPYSLSTAEPSISMPLPSGRHSCAWATPPSPSSTTNWRTKPKVAHSQSMAAGASR